MATNHNPDENTYKLHIPYPLKFWHPFLIRGRRKNTKRKGWTKIKGDELY